MSCLVARIFYSMSCLDVVGWQYQGGRFTFDWLSDFDL